MASKLNASETGAGIRTKFNALVDIVMGTSSEKIPVEALQDGNLSSVQFETLSDGTIGIKTSYLQTLGLGGGTGTANTTPAAPTNGVVNDTANTFGFTLTSGIALSGNYEYTLNGGTTVSDVTVNPIVVGDVAKANGQVGVRVKAATGRNASAWLYNTTPFAVASTGGTYTVENTYLLNFGSEFGGYPDTPPPYFNNLKPSSGFISTDSGFTSPVLVNTQNAASTITITNTGAFSGSTGQISSAQDSAGNTGVYQNEAVNTGWTLNGGTNAALRFTGLKANKFYQAYFLMPVGDPNSVRGVTVNGVTTNRTATTVLGSFGLAANGLNDPEWIAFKNITGTTFDALVKRVSGDYGAFLAMVVLEESNIAKP